MTEEYTGQFEAGVESLGSFSEQDFKEAPLVPAGVYNGEIVEVRKNYDKFNISFVVLLKDNAGTCKRITAAGTFEDDVNEPIDGKTILVPIWLPKPGDENLMESNGQRTKKEGKVYRFFKQMQALGVSSGYQTPEALNKSIDDLAWVGLNVTVKVKEREYEGTWSNEGGAMKLRA